MQQENTSTFVGQTRALALIVMGAAVLSGCGGSTKVIKEPEAIQPTQALASACSESICAHLDWVVVRNGPGAWAKNADWDEYWIRVSNRTGEPIRVTHIVVRDSLGAAVEIGGNRRQLIAGSKETVSRYKDQGLTVKAGMTGTTMLGVGGTILLATPLVAASSVAAGSTSALAAGGAAISAAVLVAPVLIVGGIARGMNESAVDQQIESRHTLLPAVLQQAERKNLHIFFPLAPSPQQVEITYVDSLGEHNLTVDTRTALDGLHMDRASE